MKELLKVAVIPLLAGLLWIACDRLIPADPVEHWPIDGAHTPLSCEDCHGETLSFTDPACAACHQEARPEDHNELACDTCHITSNWFEIETDHEFFPLVGGHTIECSSCHEPDRYRGLAPMCEGCHEDDRPNPNHNLDRECSSCHSVESWSAVNHDHQCMIPHEGNGECDDCHTNYTFVEFSCIHCHAHRKSEMDDEHEDEDDARGYIWESNACLNCHPQCEE